jgi:hypothetical protein
MAAAVKQIQEWAQEELNKESPFPVLGGLGPPNTAVIGSTVVTISYSPFESKQGPTARIEDDFYGWLLDQASLLRNKRYGALDWSNLAEELEAMAVSQENSLASYLERLLLHLLKYAYQSHKITGSWEASIENSRVRIARLLKRSPSLKNKLAELFKEAYAPARNDAGAQMRMRKREWETRLPKACPWTLEQVLDPGFWPKPANDHRQH